MINSKHAFLLLVATLSLVGCLPSNSTDESAKLQSAFKQRQSDMWITISAKVINKLSDDNVGDRHQRFIVKTSAGQTVLIVHNIDLAPRVPIRKGDRVTVRGEYEWNYKGGLIHWTHHDPSPHTPPYQGGWIKHNNKTYE